MIVRQIVDFYNVKSKDRQTDLLQLTSINIHPQAEHKPTDHTVQ